MSGSERALELNAPIHVLHVDDDPDFADLTKTFLNRENEAYNVVTATSASEGLDLISENTFHCIVSDYDMPGQDGLELLETLRDANSTPPPFILFTGKGSEEVASEAIELGASDYIQKKTGTDQYTVLANLIENSVKKWLAESRLESRYYQQRIVAELGSEAIATIDAQVLIERTVREVTEIFENECAFVMKWDSKQQTLRLIAGIGLREDDIGETTIEATLDDLQSRESTIIGSGKSNDQFGCPERPSDQDIAGVRTIIGDPENPWGVLETCLKKPRPLFEDDLNFLETLANILSNAIRQQERELDRTAFEMAVKASSHSIFVTDRDGTIQFVNPAFEEQTGYAANEAIGETPSLLKSEEHDDQFFTRLWETINSGEIWQNEVVNRNHSGGRYVVEQTIVPIENGFGEIDRFIAINETMNRDEPGDAS